MIHPEPLDLDAFIQPGQVLMLTRRKDWSWALSLNTCNPRHRKATVRAAGPTLEEALIELSRQPRP